MNVKAFIQWNTGDMYWDNIPEEEEFEGTFDQLCEHLEADESEKAELFHLFSRKKAPNWEVSDTSEEVWLVSRLE